MRVSGPTSLEIAWDAPQLANGKILVGEHHKTCIVDPPKEKFLQLVRVNLVGLS